MSRSDGSSPCRSFFGVLYLKRFARLSSKRFCPVQGRYFLEAAEKVGLTRCCIVWVPSHTWAWLRGAPSLLEPL